MKIKIVVLFIALMGCATGGTTTTPPPVVGVVADCALSSVQEVAKDNLTNVEGALVAQDWQSALMTIAKDIGVEAVACIIDYIIDESKIDARASADKNARLKVAHGEAWISEQKVTFKQAN